MRAPGEEEPIKLTGPDFGVIAIHTRYMRPSFVDALIALVAEEEAGAETPDETREWASALATLYNLRTSLG